ncbi:MAG TPA: alpha/beta hydrolase [Micromonosporaceae bacterium]|jgi:pimeloyl-ACP methyl ester carboxylesterase
MSDAPVHVTHWHEPAADGPRVVLVHGTMTWGTECFEQQRPLADEFRLDVMDRRGFGDSPDTERSDWEVDAIDVLDLLGSGAHLVGHSYGGVVAMAAAARRPDAVRSLVLIEPAALRVAEEVPVVRSGLESNRRMRAGAAERSMSAEDYLRSSADLGLPVPEFTPRRLRATRTAMAERPCWEALIPLAPLAAAPWPTIVVNGAWDRAHPGYRGAVGDALMACGAFIADRIGARSVRVPGTDHFPHRDRPELVNALLRDLWRSAA